MKNLIIPASYIQDVIRASETKSCVFHSEIMCNN